MRQFISSRARKCSMDSHFASIPHQLSEMKLREDQTEKKVNRLQAENERLVEPMRQAEAQVQELKRTVSFISFSSSALHDHGWQTFSA